MFRHVPSRALGSYAPLGRVLLKVVNPNVDVNVHVDVTYVNFAYKNIWTEFY